MLKASIKISSPVLGNTKQPNIRCRKFHLSSERKINTSAKRPIYLQKTIILKHNKDNNKRWSSTSTNTNADSGLVYKPVRKYTRFTPEDVPPEQYAQYVSTEDLAGGLIKSGAAALTFALLLVYLQSEANEKRNKKIADIEAVQSVAELDDDQLLLLLRQLVLMATVSAEHQPKVLKFVMDVLASKNRPDIMEQAVQVLRRLLTGPPIAIPTAEIIQRLTTDTFIQEIPVQTALMDFFSEAALKPSTRAKIADPLVVDYAELMTNHSEETVATKAAHILLSFARSSDQVELLGGTVHTLWNIITRNQLDEAVGYSKETLSLINARKDITQNAEFKQTVESQIRHANIHPRALDDIANSRNTHYLSGFVASNLVTAVVAAGWGLVRWHTQLARSGYHIDTPTARKIVSMRLVPTIVASLALLNFAKLTGVATVHKPNAVPEMPVLLFTGGVMAQLVPFCVVPATAGFLWTRIASRNNIVKDVNYQY